MTAEGAHSLKLIDKGVAKEALAFLVLFQFPVELVSALLAGRRVMPMLDLIQIQIQM